MSPLEPFRNQMVPISGLSNWEAEPRGEGGGAHSRIGPSWLSGSRPKRTEGSDYRCGITADQVAARELGKDTPLPSIELDRRSGLPRRQLRERLQLRVHQHAVLA